MAEVVNEAVRVDAQKIEAAIRELWRREASASGGPVTRLRTLNLVVMAGVGDNPLVDDVLAGIARRHPARVIILRIAPDLLSGALSSAVRVQTTPEDTGERQLLSEEVTLTAAPDAMSLLAGAMLPLLVADLPTFLWWAPPGNPVDHPLFAELSQVCDLTLVDTGASPAGAVATLRALAGELSRPDEPRVLDLNWGRLYAWRELTAQFFDAADLRDGLDVISTVEVRYRGEAGRSPGSTQALLYVAWLAARLGWRLAAARGRSGDREIWFERSKGDVSAHILRVEDGPGGGLIEARIVSGDERPTTEFVVRRSEDRSVFETIVTVPGGNDRRRATRFDEPGDVELLFDELDFRGGDEVFEDALRVIAQLPERER